MKSPLVVTVTGAAGQIAYSLLPRIASGEVFGEDQPILLRLLEIEPGMKSLEGVVMELNDCAFPLLDSIEATSNLNNGFDGTNWALLVGSVPRKAGMERKDLLGINGKIFVGQGEAIARNAAEDINVLVVGNPCNTNCLIAMKNAPGIPQSRWHAMTRLDENRAKSALAQKAGCHSRDITRLAIWGNHSSTLYPDFENALINSDPVSKYIPDRAWLEGDFIKDVQQRGAAIIGARGLSSAKSAAHAAIETVRSLRATTPADDWHSVAIASDGSYGVEEGLICSFPIRSSGGISTIVQDVDLGEFGKIKFQATLNELLEERAMVAELLPK
ncbi:MAG: malate dehydrogenase [Verrucomicrobiota bacterium]